VGAFARTILRPAPATRIVVELLVESGAGPTSATTTHLTKVLGDATGKTVSLAGPVALPTGDGHATEDEIRATADGSTQQRQGGGQAVLHLLFLHGDFNGKSDVLGVAVRGDVVAMFHDQIQQAATPLVSSKTVEDAVTEHEVGHLLGLVDLVLHTGREDPQHPGHSRNSRSVMYYAIDSDLIGQVFNGPPPTDFDDADRADLAALRSGA
jgi:hypothetical protein